MLLHSAVGRKLAATGTNILPGCSSICQKPPGSLCDSPLVVAVEINRLLKAYPLLRSPWRDFLTRQVGAGLVPASEPCSCLSAGYRDTREACPDLAARQQRLWL